MHLFVYVARSCSLYPGLSCKAFCAVESLKAHSRPGFSALPPIGFNRSAASLRGPTFQLMAMFQISWPDCPCQLPQLRRLSGVSALIEESAPWRERGSHQPSQQLHPPLINHHSIYKL